MPGGNCAFPTCGTSVTMKHEGTSFKITKCKSELKTKWRNDVLSILKRYREITPEVMKLVMKGKKWTCQRHYHPEDIELVGKFIKNYAIICYVCL